jgi:F420-non-reducing hydrogenase small subunit
MSSAAKPKFAMYWAAGCGGCEIAVLNMHEKILDVDAAFDVVFWPVAMDGKKKDVEDLPDGSILLTFFDGGIRTSENEEMAQLLRRKSRILVAFGSCACEGCIPGLANLTPASEILNTVYGTVSTENPDGVRPVPRWSLPEGDVELPEFRPFLRTLADVVPVDYFVPGCPPESDRIAEVVGLVLRVLRGEATLPPPGAVIGAGASTVCDECRRRRNEKKVRRFVRIQDLENPDPELCLLEQGVPCNGPATRQGCGALCPHAGAQCIGCYGPAEGVVDQGARLVSAFASVLDASEPDEIDRILDGIPDPVGQFYRFGLAGSLLRGARCAVGPDDRVPGDAREEERR